MPQYTFRSPPGWPKPPKGWVPPPGWEPDPSWPIAPADWQFYAELPFVRGAWDLDPRTRSKEQEKKEAEAKAAEVPARMRMAPADLQRKWLKKARNVPLLVALVAFGIFIALSTYISDRPVRQLPWTVLLAIVLALIFFLGGIVLGTLRVFRRPLLRSGFRVGGKEAARDDITNGRAAEFLSRASVMDEDLQPAPEPRSRSRSSSTRPSRKPVSSRSRQRK